MLTPHADKLCAEGVELDRNYVFMYCSPTRSSILSGRLPFHVNQINLGNANVGEGIPKEMTIIARKLKIAGYKTHMVGSKFWPPPPDV
jgi:arylsulfatase A-like enzyme